MLFIDTSQWRHNYIVLPSLNIRPSPNTNKQTLSHPSPKEKNVPFSFVVKCRNQNLLSIVAYRRR